MPEKIRDWNERYASGTTPWDSGEPSRELRRVLAEYGIGPRRTLEIGCGTGTNAVYLAGQGFEVTGVDVAPLAIDRAKERARAAGLRVDFRAADLLDPANVATLSSGGPYPFLFDRGVYHVLREANLPAFLSAMERLSASGGWYLLLAGNANDPVQSDQGPPRVQAQVLAAELAPLFDLVQLREFHFDGVVIDGTAFTPLAWSALWRRK